MRGIVYTALLVFGISDVAVGESLQGEYLEARNADVWTGQCFANGEINIVGNKAILAFKVTKGTYLNRRLDGLSVVAVVIGDGTFGLGKTVQSKAVLLVDENADEFQKSALVALARELAGETVTEVLQVKSTKINLQTGVCDEKGCATLEAGDARIRTRCLCKKDTVCGHEALFYPTLAKVQSARPAFALRNEYVGDGLGETFRDQNARSAILARFSL